jgi:hypothetical protein
MIVVFLAFTAVSALEVLSLDYVDCGELAKSLAAFGFELADR